MSVLTVGGRRFAAGLYWMERGGVASVARNARAFGRPWHVHWGGQTGYAADEEDPSGCPSLAASLHAHIDAPFWMALAEADDGRFALVKARDGAILADGDEVFPDRASALEAFERARDVGWALHATAGLTDGDVAGIDPAALADDPAMRLAAAPLSRVSLPQVGRFLALAAAVAVVAVVWTQRDALWRLVAGPETVAEAEQGNALVQAPADPPVTAALDAGALIAGCRQALTEHPPWMPAWRTESISCEGRFAGRGSPWYAALIAARPELEGRAVLAVRWRLEAGELPGTGRSEPLHRRIAEAHLSDWYAASVTGAAAWAVLPLEPVLRLHQGVPLYQGVPLSNASSPSLLEFRDAVDRRFGARGTSIEYVQQGGDGIEVRIATRRPPVRLTEAVTGVPGLELVRLAQNAAGEWRLEGRRVSPQAMPRSRFDQLTQSVAQPPTRSVTRLPAQSAVQPPAEPVTRSSAQPGPQPVAQPTTGSPDHG